MASSTRLAAAALGAGAVAAIPSAVFASVYVVRPGDSLGDIAARHGTTVRAMEQANHIDAGTIRIGQLLTIPDARIALPRYTRDAPDTESHAVQTGEGVFEIARRFGVDPTALARVNGIGVNAPLRAGVEITVPGRLARASALITQVAGDSGVDAGLVQALAWMESGWRQTLTSPTGAVGVMQLEPYAGDWVSRHLAGRRLDIWTAKDNVLAGTLLLRHLLASHAGDAEAALAAYYQGDASVTQHGWFEDTRRYVLGITELIATA